MPDLDNVDRAFAHLTDDLAHRSVRPGARDAIGRARRRRQTSTALLAAAAVAAVAGGGILLDRGEPQSTNIATSDGRAVPAPRALDMEAMDAATTGWISGWHEQHIPHDPETMTSCLDPATEGLDESQAPARNGLVSAGSGAARAETLFFTDFPGDGLTRWDGIFRDAFAACSGQATDPLVYADGTEVAHYRESSAGGTDVWLLRGDEEMVIALIESAEPATASTVRSYADALVAASQVDASYDTGFEDSVTESSGSTSVGPAQEATALDIDPVAAAAQGWDRAPTTEDGSTPCLPDAWASDAQSGSTGSGERGLTYAGGSFGTVSGAANAAVTASTSFLDCADGAYAEQPMGEIGKATVSVFTRRVGTTYDAAWLVLTPRDVVVFSLRGGTEPVPDSVKTRVAVAIVDQLTD